MSRASSYTCGHCGRRVPHDGFTHLLECRRTNGQSGMEEMKERLIDIYRRYKPAELEPDQRLALCLSFNYRPIVDLLPLFLDLERALGEIGASDIRIWEWEDQ